MLSTATDLFLTTHHTLPMPLIIDCYNVLHADKPPVLAGLGEASLCMLLRRSGWARSGVTVVCDGQPKPHSPDPMAVEPVELVFSGVGQSADDVIIRLIDADSAPKRLTVVSSDQEIRRAARRRRARDWTADAFLNRLAKLVIEGKTDANDATEKTSGGGGASGVGGEMSEHHIHQWLEAFGLAEERTPDEDDPFKDPWADVDKIRDIDDLDGLLDD